MFHLLTWPRRHLLLSLCLLLFLFMLIVGGGFVLVRAQTPGAKAPSCGALTLHDGGQNLYVLSQGARSTEQCFVQAYQLCQEKSLAVTWMGTDAGTTSTFTIEKQGGSCQISQSSQDYAIGQHDYNTEVSTCQGLTQSTTSLILRHCGSEGDIIIPRSESCGSVYPQQTPAVTEQAEACFIQDYHQCYGAELSYEPSGSLAYNFQLDFSCKLTVFVSNAQTRFSCSGLVQQADGLHALNCSSEGTILIPAHP